MTKEVKNGKAAGSAVVTDEMLIVSSDINASIINFLINKTVKDSIG